jgi:hypothetical protein
VIDHSIWLKFRQSQNGTLNKPTITSPLKEVMPYAPIKLERGGIIIQKNGTTYIKAASTSR